MIGSEGSVFEGRGWNVVGAHTLHFNDVGYGIDFIGTYDFYDPTPMAQEAYHMLAQVSGTLISRPQRKLVKIWELCFFPYYHS